MAVVIQDIRDRLDALASTQVPDATLTAALNDAIDFVDSVKASDALLAGVEKAQLRYAVYLAYVSYAEGISMQRGGLPEISKIKIDELRMIAELFINKIAQDPVSLNTTNGELQLGLPPVAGTTSSSAFYDSITDV